MNHQELIVKLSRFGVEDIKYYHKKTPLANIYDICILLDKNNKILSRGISICSILDQYIKKTGKNKSFGRAVKALENKINSFEINPSRINNTKFVKRSFKSKSKDQDEKIRDRLKDIPISKREISDNVIEYYCKIPLLYPVLETIKEFRFKSEFLPKPTKFEKKIIKKK